jgi:hypothetical protein
VNGASGAGCTIVNTAGYLAEHRRELVPPESPRDAWSFAVVPVDPNEEVHAFEAAEERQRRDRDDHPDDDLRGKRLKQVVRKRFAPPPGAVWVERVPGMRPAREWTERGIVPRDETLVEVPDYPKRFRRSAPLEEALGRGIAIERAHTCGPLRVWHCCGNDPPRVRLASRRRDPARIPERPTLLRRVHPMGL